ncbi:MAG TPA: DMT family transporter [Thermoleophilaceae bacterium]|nr:DMT family transporter [Thermoleophilaceae bacterium]
MSRRTIASATIAACAASWGGIGIVVRELDMPPLAIAFFQEAQCALVAAAIALVVRPAALRPPRPAVIALGLVLAAHFACLFAAVRETSVASAILVTYSAPILIAILAPALLGERVSRVTAGALGVSAAGVASIALAGGGAGGAVRAAGIGLALLAALTYAVFVVLLKRFTAEVNPLTVQAWQAGAAALALSPGALAGGYSLGGREIAYLVLLGVGITGLTGVAYVFALRFVPATTAGILGYLEPLSAVVLAAALLGERVGAWTLIGGAAIVAAGVVVVVEDARVAPVAPVSAAPPLVPSEATIKSRRW